MIIIFYRQWLPPLCVLLGYAVLMALNPVRHSLLDGLRAFRRYRRLWMIPAGLGLCYALFHAGLAVFFYKVLPLEQQPAFGWKFSWSMPPPAPQLWGAHGPREWLCNFFTDVRWQIVRDAGRDGLESLAGLFNNVVTTFPFSAVAAVLLLANWEDHHRTLRNALRRRFGGDAWIIHAFILLCAISAIVAPILFGPSLIYLNRVAPGLLLVRWASLIDWLSSLFAYLFGVGVQVYLILVVYTWLRGLTWTSVHLMDMAIRRFSFVVKWAAVVMSFSSLLIDMPRVAAMLFRFDDSAFLNHTFTYTDYVARPLLALLLIFFSTMQVTLTFHSETLAKALDHHWQFLRRYWGLKLWFLLIAAIHLFALALLNRWLSLGFGGESTLAGMIWNFIYPLLEALLGAWLLASWVSLYKRCETGRVQAPDWIPILNESMSSPTIPPLMRVENVVATAAAPSRYACIAFDRAAAVHAALRMPGSGAGLLLRILGLLERPDAGEVWFESQPTRPLDEAIRLDAAQPRVRVPLRGAVPARFVFRGGECRDAALQNLAGSTSSRPASARRRCSTLPGWRNGGLRGRGSLSPRSSQGFARAGACDRPAHSHRRGRRRSNSRRGTSREFAALLRGGPEHPRHRGDRDLARGRRKCSVPIVKSASSAARSSRIPTPVPCQEAPAHD